MALAQAGRAKKIKIYKNGDVFFTGKDIVVNKRVPTLDSFLQTLTSDLKTTDAVRRLVTPTHGHQITQLEDIQDSRPYVAVGNGRFKNVGYLKASQQSPAETRSVFRDGSQVRPVEHNRRLGRVVSGRIKRVPTDALTIFVYANGRREQTARRLTLSYKVRDNWDAILREVDEKVRPSIGATRKLYTLQGALLKGPDDLQPHGYYVAVGSEMGGFRKLDYGATLRTAFNSPQRGRQRLKPIHYMQKKPSTGKTTVSEPLLSVNKSPSCKSDNRGTKSDGQCSPASKQRLPTEQHNRPSTESESEMLPPSDKRTQQDVFHAKPVKPRISKDSGKKVDYDKDEGGIFRAKTSPCVEGAEEVEETKDTQVDLPIDQMEAEEVKDEDISDEPLKTSRWPPKENSPSPTPKEKSRTTSPPKEKTPTAPFSPKPLSPAVVYRIPTLQNEAKEEQDVSQHRSKEDEAAANIQAGYRGMQTRREMQKAKEQKDNTKEQEQRGKSAPTKIQAGAINYKNRQNAKEMKAKKEEERVNLRVGATKIQAGVRGYGTRKKSIGSLKPVPHDKKTPAMPSSPKPHSPAVVYKIPTPQNEAEEEQDVSQNQSKDDEAAANIQTGHRGMQTHRGMQKTKEQKDSTKEQDHGYETSLTTSPKERTPTASSSPKPQSPAAVYRIPTPQNEAEEEQDASQYRSKDVEAAANIQAGYRGMQTRREMQKAKEQKDSTKEQEQKGKKAATKIQADFNKYKTSQNVKEMKVKKEEERVNQVIATKIRPGTRCYETRKKIVGSKSKKKINT